MLRDLLDKGKCRLGLHAGEWAYVERHSCEQARVCTRCGDRSTRLAHDWPPFAPAPDDPCRLERRCARCALQQSTTEHEWAPPRYPEAGACAQVRPCTRCSAEEPAATAHVMDEWAYVSADDCTQSVGCSRCGEPGTDRRRHHDWEGWRSSTFYDASVCVCRHCGEMVIGPHDDPGDPSRAASFTQACEAVGRLLAAPDATSLRHCIETSPEVLLGPVAPRCLDFIDDQVAVTDEDREMLRGHAALLERCRTDGIDAVFGPVAPPPAPSPPADEPPATSHVPTGLRGHWRSTEVLGGGGGPSMLIETHLVLDAGGRFLWWSSGDNQEGGRWSASADVLEFAFDDGSELSRRYQRSGSQMIFPDDSRYRFWERL